jgi:hypothetical protein
VSVPYRPISIKSNIVKIFLCLLSTSFLLPGLEEFTTMPLEKMNFCLLIYFSGWFYLSLIILGEDFTLPGSGKVIGAQGKVNKVVRCIVLIASITFVIYSLLLIYNVLELELSN